MPVDSTIPAHAVPPEPWHSFLQDFDTRLKAAVALRCLGGFVVTQQYGIGRGTSDIDFLSVTAVSADDNVEVLGGLGSDLHKKYRVYLQYVGIATPPCDYADRLQRMFPGCRWAKLQLFALDPIDLALSKLERNSDRDREDVLPYELCSIPTSCPSGQSHAPAAVLSRGSTDETKCAFPRLLRIAPGDALMRLRPELM